MADEQWRTIPGFAAYEASTAGRIRRVVPGRGVPAGHVLRASWAGSTVKYRRLGLYADDGARRLMYVHRLVMLAFVGPCPDGHSVEHVDADSGNNALANLRYILAELNSYEGSMRRWYGPAREDWSTWEADSGVGA